MYSVYEKEVKKPQLAIVGLPNAEVAEILAIMKFELEYNVQKLTRKEAELLEMTIKKVVRCSKVNIPKISAFYIPSIDVELESCYHLITDTQDNFFGVPLKFGTVLNIQMWPRL
ncbi:Serine/threonine protein kinase [Phytophthora palmivora]|uniref:Serine/threonine protein kinase n=1 Tax=Phytophthora palmivora TaxID=4796 RepID=A0A2P4XUG6_9STRA|nr:Serine/threonine protein kinase [Phytophthora palmivora]